jgi:hypothetical protein
MLNGRTVSDMAGPAVAGGLIVALVWAIVELAPIAARRWFGF